MEQKLIDFLDEEPLEEIKDAVRKFPDLAIWEIGPMLVKTEEILCDIDRVIASDRFTPTTSSMCSFTEVVSSGTPIPPDTRIPPWEPSQSHSIGEQGFAFMNNRFSMTWQSACLRSASRSAGRKLMTVNSVRTPHKALATRQPKIAATNSEKKWVSPSLAVQFPHSEVEWLLQHIRYCTFPTNSSTLMVHDQFWPTLHAFKDREMMWHACYDKGLILCHNSKPHSICLFCLLYPLCKVGIQYSICLFCSVVPPL